MLGNGLFLQITFCIYEEQAQHVQLLLIMALQPR